jgi:hypothetical protein
MKRMPDGVRDAINAELSAARSATTTEARWHCLERAHILSQAWAISHAGVHARMLVHAVRQRDRHEAIGQVVRLIVAAPGSLSGRYPLGNTGRSSVGLMTPMPVPADLEAALASTRT